jgi:Skp family chaperone for outer membrane proteins
VRAHDGGPGRVAGRIQSPLIVGNAKPDLMAEVVFDDPYVQRMHAENRLALSTGFTAGHDDDGHLTEAVKWNHLLVFVKDEKNQPRDPATGFLNKEGDDMTDEIDEGAGDKSKPKPPAKPDEGSTDSRLKALIADLLVRLDEVFSSAEQLSDEAGDEGDPDPAVSGKGKAPEEDEEEEPVKRNMNENHDEMGRFTSGGGSSGGAKSVGKSVARKLGNRPSNPSGLSDENHAIARDLAKIVEEDVRNGADAETAVSDALATFDSHSVADGGDELSDKAFLAMLPKEISSQVGAPRSESAGGTFPAVKSALESALPGKSIQVMPKEKGHSGELPPIKIDGETYITNGNEGFDDFQSRLLASEGWKKKGAIRIPTGKKWAVYMPKSHFDRLEQEYLDRLKSNQADLSNADYSWDDCIEEQLAKGYDQAKAEKICGYIKAKNNLQEMRVGRSLAGSDPEEDIMGAEMDALKSKLDAANKELDDKKKELDAANQKLAVVAQAEKDAAWENMKSSHVPKGWLAGATDEEKANKERALRTEFEQTPVGFANKILDLAKGRGGQDKSKEEGAAFGNKDGDANDVLSVTRELRASSGRR